VPHGYTQKHGREVQLGVVRRLPTRRHLGQDSAGQVHPGGLGHGQGLTLAHTAGLRTGCITGRESAALRRRAQEMKMEFIYMKQALKMPAYEEILRKAGVSDSAVAYIGDDLPDIPLLRRAGLAIAVGNAVPEVKQAAHYTTKALPGHGAVREAVELVLRSKDVWKAMIDKARA